jgi:putative inorganic carbon (HCO3(-)) transporter
MSLVIATEPQEQVMRGLLRLINRWEWLILLLILPILMFPSGSRGLVLLVIPLLWFIRWLDSGRFIPHTPFDTILLLLLAMVLVSLTAVFDITLSFPKIAGVLAGIALFYAAVEFTRQREGGLWAVLLLVLAVGAAMTLIGLVGAEWPGPFSIINRIVAGPAGGRIHILGTVGGVVNSNELAGALGWIAPLAIACTIGLGGRLLKSDRLALFLLIMVALSSTLTLIATESRGGILALAVAMLVMPAVAFRGYRWLLLLTGAAVLALAVGVLTFQVPGSPDPVGDTIGVQGRLEIWSRAILAIQDFPLTGLSMNGFRRIVHLLYPLFSISPETDLAHAHNHLLQAGLDLGLAGLIAYLSLWVLASFLLWKSWRLTRRSRKQRRHPLRVLIVGLSGSLAAGWVFGIMDAIALGARPGVVWWLLLAMVTAVHDQARAAAVASLHRRRRRMVEESAEAPAEEAVKETPPDENPPDEDIPEIAGNS